MKDLYKTLNVSKNASAADVKKAYRKLAKELHPDLHQGDEKIADRFKEVSAAYAILGDEKARARYDRGEIDDNGNERGFAGNPNGRRTYERAAGGGFSGFEQGGFAGFSAEDIFSDIFSNLRGGGRGRAGKQANHGPIPERGNDKIYEVQIDFLDAVNGVKRQITLENGKTLNVQIPKDVKEGQQIRLKGQGGPGPHNGPAGDALIQVRINAHPFFRRDGNDIHLDLPVTLQEAVLGGKVPVPTLDGSVNLTIPAGSNSGKTLRLKGKGVDQGDLYVRLIVTLPETIDNELRQAVENWSKSNDYTVRDHLK